VSSPPPALPPLAPGTALRILASNDLLGTVLPLPTTCGRGGSIAGIVALLERQRESIPTIWVDSGDLTVGGRSGLFGHRTLTELACLPIAAATVGNHELDEGPAVLAVLADQLRFPLLCADRDVGRPSTAVIDTPAGEVGVIGITHPCAHELAVAPMSGADWAAQVAGDADQLRRAGARWVIALLHDGATWWSNGFPGGVGTRSGALAAATRGWADHVDAILGGHTLAAWVGTLHQTPAGHAHAFAASVLAVDLRSRGLPVIHSPVRVPPLRSPSPTPAMTAIETAATRLVGEAAVGWESRPGAPRYLPDLVAAAIRKATGADAGFIPPGLLFTQAPIDGTVAALLAGPVSELDLIRLFPFDDDRIAIAELNPGEYRSLLDAHDAATDPANTAADGLWWNWARAPAGASRATDEPTTVAVARFTLPLVSAWLGRELTAHPAAPGGRRALELELNR
jgi:2',3'-cyclic-nucleotide 2'-phosphodiesterase (5'-nucleotidase family)